MTDQISENLRIMIQQAVDQMTKERGSLNVIHPELGIVVKNGKATHALIAFFKKLERKLSKGKDDKDVKIDIPKP